MIDLLLMVLLILVIIYLIPVVSLLLAMPIVGISDKWKLKDYQKYLAGTFIWPILLLVILAREAKKLIREVMRE